MNWPQITVYIIERMMMMLTAICTDWRCDGWPTGAEFWGAAALWPARLIAWWVR
jgi:hypothetical protein